MAFLCYFWEAEKLPRMCWHPIPLQNGHPGIPSMSFNQNNGYFTRKSWQNQSVYWTQHGNSSIFTNADSEGGNSSMMSFRSHLNLVGHSQVQLYRKWCAWHCAHWMKSVFLDASISSCVGTQQMMRRILQVIRTCPAWPFLVLLCSGLVVMTPQRMNKLIKNVLRGIL